MSKIDIGEGQSKQTNNPPYKILLGTGNTRDTQNGEGGTPQKARVRATVDNRL